MYEFLLPDIGEGISEAVLIEWVVAVGDSVEEGDDIGHFETDKTAVEIPSPRKGVIKELCWKKGDTVPVGSIIVRIDTGKEEAPAVRPSHAAASGSTAVRDQPASPPPGSPATASTRVNASPALRKLAADLKINLANVVGSGPGGRIERADIEAAAKAPEEADNVTREPLGGVQIAMAQRLSKAVQTMVHSTLNFEVPADNFEAALETARATAADNSKPSVTALIIHSVAKALSRHRYFNARIDESAREIVLYDDVNMNVAVASERGLLVPVLRGVNRMSIAEVSTALRDLSQRAQHGKLTPADSRGGTFTLSSTGRLETARITSTRPIISVDQTAVLWVSRIAEQPRVINGALAIGKVMNCSLSFDHRYIDGATAVAFINDIAATLENPRV